MIDAPFIPNIKSVSSSTHSSYLSSSKPLFINTNILPINEFISLETAMFMFKLQNNMLPEVFSNYFTMNYCIHNYNTRNAHNIHPPFNRIALTQSSIFHKGSVLWNNLPISLKNSRTIYQFKRQCRQYLFHQM